MKDFIQKQLRLMLEGVYATKSEIARFKHKMISNKLNFQEPYFNDVNMGDGTYVVRFDRRGVSIPVSKRGDAATLNTRIGDRGGDTAENYITFNIKAYRGIEHPGTFKERTGHAMTRGGQRIGPGEIGDPYSDAVIKAINVYGEEILRFMKEVTYTDDDSGAKRAATLNDPEFADRMQAKLDFDKRRRTKSRSLAPDIKELVRQKEELVNRLQTLVGAMDKESRTERKKISAEIKRLTKDINDLEYEGSSKDLYLKSKNKSKGF